MNIPHENLNSTILHNAEITTALSAIFLAFLSEVPPEKRGELCENACRVLDTIPQMSLYALQGVQVSPTSDEMNALRDRMKALIRAYFAFSFLP
jgi:hypothetical protein